MDLSLFEFPIKSVQADFPAFDIDKRIGVKKWKSYDFSMESEIFDNIEFDFLFVPAHSDLHEVECPSSEPFNHELLKIDTSNTEEVLDYIDRYGLPFSPLYNSKERFLSGQLRTKKSPYPTGRIMTTYEVASAAELNGKRLSLDGLNETGFFQDSVGSNDPHRYIRRELIHVELLSFLCQDYEPDVSNLLFACYSSEYARHNCYAKDPDCNKYGGIISLPEVKSTLRLLQVLFPLLALDSYASCTAMLPSEAVAYLANKKYVNQKGAFYFFKEGKPKVLTEEDIEALATRLYTSGNFETTENAREAAAIHLGLKLSDEINKALSNASLFFDLSKRWVLGRNPSLFHTERPPKYSLMEHLKSLLKTQMDHEAEVAENEEGGSLTEALYGQFQFEENLDGDWMRCQNCGRVFKLAKESSPLKSKVLRTACYCKKSCMVSASNKKARRSKSSPE